jgi:hypothetical protein
MSASTYRSKVRKAGVKLRAGEEVNRRNDKKLCHFLLNSQWMLYNSPFII